VRDDETFAYYQGLLLERAIEEATERGDIAAWINLLKSEIAITARVRALLVQLLERSRYMYRRGRRPDSPDKRFSRNPYLFMAAEDLVRLEELWKVCNGVAGEELEQRFKELVDRWEKSNPGITDGCLLWRGLKLIRSRQSESRKRLTKAEVRRVACEFLAVHYREEAESEGEWTMNPDGITYTFVKHAFRRRVRGKMVTESPVTTDKLINFVSRGPSARQRLGPKALK
jgi:hypothetical protein